MLNPINQCKKFPSHRSNLQVQSHHLNLRIKDNLNPRFLESNLQKKKLQIWPPTPSSNKNNLLQFSLIQLNRSTKKFHPINFSILSKTWAGFIVKCRSQYCLTKQISARHNSTSVCLFTKKKKQSILKTQSWIHKFCAKIRVFNLLKSRRMCKCKRKPSRVIISDWVC